MPDSPQFESIARACAVEQGLEFVRYCGMGAFKETYLVEKAGNSYALKIVDGERIEDLRTEREIAALEKCKSPFISRLVSTGSFFDARRRFAFIVEEYFGGGTLTTRLNTQTSRGFFSQVFIGLLHALSELQALGLVHRDIKPDNIMFHLESDTPALVDFGLVRDLSQHSLTESWVPRGPGTPLYSSPEQLNNDKSFIDWRSDQFSIAIVISFAVFGFHPMSEPGGTTGQTVAAVAERAKPAERFFDSVRGQPWLKPLIRMLRPWPVLRYQEASEIISRVQPQS